MELVTDKKTKEGYDSELRMGYKIYKKALQKGLILRPLGNVLYFNPPLIINEEEIDKAVAICKEAIEEIIGR
jgi:adenosylmethionine-8-amino-7-oxononanoate aminotransferase